LGNRLEQARSAILKETTLAQLVQKRDQFKQPLPMFYI
jgi:hypothetical protein